MDIFVPQASLDFHKLGILSKEEINYYTEKFLNDSLSENLHSVQIITGKGEVVRPLVINFLKKSVAVKKYNFADYYSGQNGVIQIILN